MFLWVSSRTGSGEGGRGLARDFMKRFQVRLSVRQHAAERKKGRLRGPSYYLKSRRSAQVLAASNKAHQTQTGQHQGIGLGFGNGG